MTRIAAVLVSARFRNRRREVLIAPAAGRLAPLAATLDGLSRLGSSSFFPAPDTEGLPTLTRRQLELQYALVERAGGRELRERAFLQLFDGHLGLLGAPGAPRGLVRRLRREVEEPAEAWLLDELELSGGTARTLIVRPSQQVVAHLPEAGVPRLFAGFAGRGIKTEVSLGRVEESILGALLARPERGLPIGGLSRACGRYVSDTTLRSALTRLKGKGVPWTRDRERYRLS